MASRDDKEMKGREAIEEIDRRLGGLLGPLAEGLARIVDAAEKAQDAGDGSREATVETSRGPVKMRSGFTVKVGGLAGGGRAETARDPARPVATPTAAAQPAEPPVGGTDRAEPHHDVFETETSWSLAAELPGAAEADLTLALADGRLTVETAGARRWRLVVDAPAWLTREALSTRLVNGILDIAAQRGDDA